MTDEEIADQKNYAVRKARAILAEHFDAGLILVSATAEGDRTGLAFSTFGNTFACDGMAHAYLREATVALD